MMAGNPWGNDGFFNSNIGNFPYCQPFSITVKAHIIYGKICNSSTIGN
jgi:hypothetical protein